MRAARASYGGDGGWCEILNQALFQLGTRTFECGQGEEQNDPKGEREAG